MNSTNPSTIQTAVPKGPHSKYAMLQVIISYIFPTDLPGNKSISVHLLYRLENRRIKPTFNTPKAKYNKPSIFALISYKFDETYDEIYQHPNDKYGA